MALRASPADACAVMRSSAAQQLQHGRSPSTYSWCRKSDGNMSRSVLIVDDEPNIVRSLQFLMTKAGYDVRVARDGEQALEEIAKAQPDLVLLDAMMPKRDGFDVCQTIRANPHWSGVRVIMLTAKGRDIEREKGLAMGADDYITKPFSTKEVVAQVEKMLGRAEEPGNE
jgi:two-component system alkaline phosphatase synthesis response regulator PhoP